MSAAASAATKAYDDPIGDLVVRSSDNIDYRVSAARLKFTSGVFEDMIGSADAQVGEKDEKGLPVVRVAEKGDVLGPFLRFLLHPRPSVGDTVTIDALRKLLSVMEKYDCPAAAHNAVAYMAPYIARYSPLAFGLAVIHGNQSIAKLALQQICTYDCGIPGDLGVVQQCSAWLANIPSHLFRKIPPDVIHQVLLFQQQYLTNTAVEPHLATFSHWSDITDGLVLPD